MNNPEQMSGRKDGHTRHHRAAGKLRYCPHCKRHVEVCVVEEGREQSSAAVSMLLRVFSPGEGHPDRIYECEECHTPFEGLSMWDALIVPAGLTGIALLMVAAFIIIILSVFS